MLNFGSTIKKYRKSRGLLQEELADRLGIIGTYLSALENNRREPTISLLRKISSVLDIPIEVVFWDAVQLDNTFTKRDQKIISTAQSLVAQLNKVS